MVAMVAAVVAMTPVIVVAARLIVGDRTARLVVRGRTAVVALVIGRLAFVAVISTQLPVVADQLLERIRGRLHDRRFVLLPLRRRGIG